MKVTIDKLVEVIENPNIKDLKSDIFQDLVTVGLLQEIQAGNMPLHHCTANNHTELNAIVNGYLRALSEKIHTFLEGSVTNEQKKLVEPFVIKIDAHLELVPASEIKTPRTI